ncbi:DUF6562 domain-containing protein [Butyricimonas synergistica]|uniref:DUF6562 domain-containing protein n=1 Tax=Butyricimonas synergistica TaxID=544644 RepID=UPI0003A452F7|nr:DUF6562 domain-containing protein [Butyricimonas synergistica]
MKKMFLIIASLALTLVACQKDEIEGFDAANSQTISVTIPRTSSVSRAAGDGTQINRCIMEIYRNGELYGERKIATVSGNKASFTDLRLVTSQTYDFVFWADCAEGEADKHYTTTNGLTTIKATRYAGNNEEFDAFFAKETFEVIGAFTKEITLTRPFGQLNVKTLDLGAIKDENLKPTHVKVNFKAVPSTFNALTGEASEETPLEYTAEVSDAATGLLTIDYIWATPEEDALADFSMTFTNNGNEITTNDAFTNIPIRRNYKTNVSGNLLTKAGNINVTIDPNFEDNIDQNVYKVQNIAEANEAFANGATNVIVTEIPTEAATLILPKTRATVSATLPKLTYKLTVLYANEASDEQKPAMFYLTTEADEIEIETPNTTVTLLGAMYQNVTAKTAENTLIVGEETIIENLIVLQGNVDVYGTVKKIVKKASNTQVILHASTAGKLSEFAENLNNTTNIYNKVVLNADIDFKGTAFSIKKANKITFDGQGHTLSNFKVENTQTAGLFCDAISVTVTDLTVKGATVKAVNDGNGNAYAGVIIGRSYGTIILDNCIVEGSTVEGVNKVGGMIGFVAENHVEATNCKVVNSTISNENVNSESGQIGGFAGYIGNCYKSTCLFTNCSVENSEINAYLFLPSSRHISKFIGTFQGSEDTDGLTIDNCSVKDVTLNGMNSTAQSFVSLYGDLLGGNRYGKGKITITNCDENIYISSQAQLAQLASMVNKGTNFKGKTLKLTNNIDLENKEWKPIGLQDKAFQGTFDGCGYTISNLKINQPSNQNVGLFGYTTNGEIKNFTLHNATVSGYLNVGAIAGTPYTSTYSDIRLTGKVQINGYAYVGGMLGKNAYANLNNLTIDVEEGSLVHAQSEAYRSYVGGLVGFMGEGNILVSNITSNINVTGSTCDVGGITGIAHYNNTFENCICTGNVTLQNANDPGDEQEIGGIAGVWNNTNGTKVIFRNCRFNGTLSSTLKGEDKSEEIADSNRITGRKYSTDGTGELIIE